MDRKAVVCGMVGAIVLLALTFVLNGVIGFNARLSMRQVPREREVHNVLKSHIVEPGRYLCNPALTPDGRFPDNQPVFGIQYSGAGHEAAGFGAILGLLQFVIEPFIVAWLLSRTSERVRSRFANRLGYIVAIGVLLAITGDVSQYGIGGSPLGVALLFALRTVVSWTVVGLAMAWLMPPGSQKAASH